MSQAVEKYILGEMAEAERLSFEEHYFDCAECAAGVEAGAVLAANAKPVFEEEARAARPERAWFRWLWPAAAFAGLFLALIAFVRVAELKSQLALVRAPETYPVFFLHGVARSGGQLVTVPKRAQNVGMALDVPPGRPFPEYECSLQDAAGVLKWSITAPSPPPGQPINVLIRAASIEAGRYTLILAGREGRSATELQRIPFSVQLE